MSIAVFIRPGCTGMGSCARIAPEVFRLDPATGQAKVVVQDAAPHREAVTRAARSCPFIGVAIDGVPLDEPVAEAVVVGLAQLAPSVVELRVRSKGFGFKPGQYAFVRLHDDRGEFFRSYSVVEAAGGIVVFSVRIVPQGRGGAVLSKLTPGQRVGLSRAAGSFALLTKDQPKLFVTGGTGLAPVLPMLLAAPDAAKTVIFGGRSVSDFFYLDRLQCAPNTKVILVASDPPPEWPGKRGLVTHAMEELDLAGFAEVYTSGSPAMVTAVRDRLVARGFPAERIFSDAFEPGGPAAAKNGAPATPPSTTPPRPQRDWPGLVRMVHFHASLALALVFLFYAVTGFIANRATWFVAEDTTAPASPAVIIPTALALERDVVVPYLLGLLPVGAQPADWHESENSSTATFTLAEREIEFAVDKSDRSLRRADWQRIPNEVGLTPSALLPWLVQKFPGEPDHKAMEDDDVMLAVEIESVWGVHSLMVDKEHHRFRATSTHPHLVVSLIDLHRGKHAGVVQRVLVDLTAVALAGLTLSGVAMGVFAPGRRRRVTIGAVSLSLLVLTLLLIAR